MASVESLLTTSYLELRSPSRKTRSYHQNGWKVQARQTGSTPNRLEAIADP
jgi:hypothetical protein